MSSKPLSLFEGYGVELEYMIVDSTTLGVRPITDRVLAEVAGEITTEVELEEIAWSNELALHVIELKTNGPASSLDGLAHLTQLEALWVCECQISTVAGLGIDNSPNESLV